MQEFISHPIVVWGAVGILVAYVLALSVALNGYFSSTYRLMKMRANQDSSHDKVTASK